MASGSSKGFDFASDDILCSYEDYANQETSNGNHSDSAIGTNSAKQEFHKNRMARTPVFPSSYSPPGDSSNQEVIILAVERSMKKNTDNLMRFLEGLSSRLSQLELYCYNLDKSIGEMRSDLTRDHEESDAKLKFLEKHVQEVHRSVQILRDKQELADTQKELAKLQLAQKESSSSQNSQQNEDRSSTPDAKKNDHNSGDSHGQQLALALPSQVAPPPAAQQPPRAVQPQGYYLPPPPPGPTQVNQNQYLQPQPQVQPQQQPPPQQPPQIQSYQQQWAQQPPMQPGSRPSSPQVYPQYPEPPPANSMPMQMQLPYSAVAPPASSQPMTYAYSGPVRTGQPPQHLKPAFGGQPGDGYAASGPPQGNSYMMYGNQSSPFPQGGYPPNPQQTGGSYPPNTQQTGGAYPPNPQQSGGGSGGGMMSRPAQQFNRNHPYNELIDKLVSMGYRGDHVMSVIQRLDETGQTVDFNAVLDRLNGHAGGGSQRGWSG